jgi:hypothetical protein
MRNQPTQKKTAVDSTAEDYWIQYFGPYGKTFVKKIPRRVASILVPRTAARGDDHAALMKKARVVPLTPKPIINKDGIQFEGAFFIEGRRGSGRAFVAKFGHDGRLLHFDAVPAPVNAAA